MSGRLIGITGRAGCGKDTAAQALIEDGWVLVKFATPIVEAVKALDLQVFDRGCYVRLTPLLEADYERTKRRIPEARRLLQRMGTEVGRTLFGPDCWVDRCAHIVEDLLKDDKNVVISDVRFENEAEMIGCYGELVEILRPEADSAAVVHASEGGVPRSLVHHTVYNTDTVEELHQVMRRIARGAQ